LTAAAAEHADQPFRRYGFCLQSFYANIDAAVELDPRAFLFELYFIMSYY
jgi:hypothetical protein